MANSEFGAEHSQDDEIVGQAPTGDDSPGEYESSDQSGGQSEDTGVTYDAEGEPESTPNDGPVDTDIQESNPSGGGPEGLRGDLGVSSERPGPYGTDDPAGEGIQGTGSVGSSLTDPEGTKTTERRHPEEPAEGRDDLDQPGADSAPGSRTDAGAASGSGSGASGPEMDDQQQEATQGWRDGQPSVDRTVGEDNTAEVPSQDFDPSKNPGHSHG